MANKPSTYELQALAGIHEWKDPEISGMRKALNTLGSPLNRYADLMSLVPGFDWVMEKSVGEMIRLLNDIAHWSVRREAIFAEYRKNGCLVQTPADIFSLDLEDVDKVLAGLATKYIALAGGEGAATGAIGVMGIPTDIVALVTLNLRAIAEYATYCGFDITTNEERLFAMNILFLASSPTARAKQIAMAQLVRIARDVSSKHSLNYFQKNAFSQVIQQFAKSLGQRLGRIKFGQFVPLAGGLIGGGQNAYLTAQVCKDASNLYRERFLAQKYGPELIEVTVEPASDFLIENEE